MIYNNVLAASLLAVGAAATASLELATPVASTPIEVLKELFQRFKERHSRVYDDDAEEGYRFNVFVDSLKLVEQRNAGGNSVHGITRFADLTQQEFESKYLDRYVSKKLRGLNATITTVEPYVGAATSVDYTGKQTTAVKDQGNCGSCFAHAAAQQLESDGMRLLGNSASLTLSVQQIVSCDKGEGQHGCMGGLQETSFDYIRENGGIVTEADYPYSSYNGRTGKCDTSKNNYVVGVTGYEMILRSDVKDTEADFTSYMLSTGTISIGVDATTWNTYKGGIMTDCGKGTDINHAVQLTGVDTAKGWWKIRNSWSADWGEEGSIFIKYGTNTCGLATEGGSHTTVYNIKK